MTVTVDSSKAPQLDPRVEVGVHIIKLPSRQAVGASRGCDPNHADVMKEAAILAGAAQPTDIVVFDHRPWHKVGVELKAHPQVHIDYPETILKISYGGKQHAVWWSTEPFTVLRVVPAPHHPAVATAPLNPFEGPDPPYPAKPLPGAPGVYAFRAEVLLDTAVGHLYKITLEMGELIDPDMFCTP